MWVLVWMVGFFLYQFCNLNGHTFWCFAWKSIRPGCKDISIEIGPHLNSLDISINFEPKHGLIIIIIFRVSGHREKVIRGGPRPKLPRPKTPIKKKIPKNKTNKTLNKNMNE